MAAGTRDLRDCRNKNNYFNITNWTADGGMDCDTAADAEIADVLATLIRNLIDLGIINGNVA